MDQLVRGLLNSQQPSQHRTYLFKKIIEAGKRANSKQDVFNVLEVTSECVVTTTDAERLQHAMQLFRTWASTNTSTLIEFSTEEKISYLLEKNLQTVENAIKLVYNILGMVKEPSPASYQLLCVAARNHVLCLVKERPQYVVLRALCGMLNEHPTCVPVEDDALEFCCAVIRAACFFPSPLQQPGSIKMINHINDTIGGVVGKIWATMKVEQLNLCLQTILEHLQMAPVDGKSPSSALGGIVQHLPTSVIPSAVEAVLLNKDINDDQLAKILGRMIYWASWPNVKNIDAWVISFLKGLVLYDKYDMIIELGEYHLDMVFSRLQYPVVRSCAQNIFEFIVLTVQDSPDLFHKIAGKVPDVLRLLNAELFDEKFPEAVRLKSKTTLDRLAEIVYCLMNYYQGFPDIYAPILKALKETEILPPTSERQASLLAEYCLVKRTEAVIRSQDTLASSISETGKRGLLNLGNTCYMNSVVQVLFMCDNFRNGLLETPVSLSKAIISQMQILFALLTSSLRPIIAPETFYQVSRPEWFGSYEQQDCSEFLHYLLDQLSMEEVKKTHEHRVTKAAKQVEKAESSVSPKKKSLVDSTFAGKLAYTHKCVKCRNQSVRQEKFTDVSLSFPEVTDGPGTSSTSLRGGMATRGSQRALAASEETGSSAGDKLTITQLLNNYLSVEKLVGKEQYECDHCQSHQDGERWIQILESPDYLILTLLRFSYNIKTNNQNKIFTALDYPKTLHLPLSQENNKGVENGQNSGQQINHQNRRQDHLSETYCLCGVVVHSGSSSHSGHYYAYARHGKVSKQLSESSLSELNNVPQGEVTSSDVDYLEDQWFSFNDSRVSHAAYSSFCDLTKTFHRDTPYILVYKKITSSILGDVVDSPLNSFFTLQVSRDNEQYLKDRQQEEKKRIRRQSLICKDTVKTNWDPNDRQDPPGSWGGGGWGFSGLDGPKYVF